MIDRKKTNACETRSTESRSDTDGRVLSQTFCGVQNILPDLVSGRWILLTDVVRDSVEISHRDRIEDDGLHACCRLNSATGTRRPGCCSASSSRDSSAWLARRPNTVCTAASSAESTEANCPLATCSRSKASAGAVRVAVMGEVISSFRQGKPANRRRHDQLVTPPSPAHLPAPHSSSSPPLQDHTPAC